MYRSLKIGSSVLILTLSLFVTSQARAGTASTTIDFTGDYLSMFGTTETSLPFDVGAEFTHISDVIVTLDGSKTNGYAVEIDEPMFFEYFFSPVIFLEIGDLNGRLTFINSGPHTTTGWGFPEEFQPGIPPLLDGADTLKLKLYHTNIPRGANVVDPVTFSPTQATITIIGTFVPEPTTVTLLVIVALAIRQR